MLSVWQFPWCGPMKSLLPIITSQILVEKVEIAEESQMQ